MNIDSNLDAKYETENQDALSAYGAEKLHVVRDWRGNVLQAVATYADGTQDILFHNVSRESLGGPVHVSSSTRSSSGEQAPPAA
jgi:hypothetical protein